MTYAISDIHGCLTAFNTLLSKLNLTPNDTLITIGDYIDRGPDSKGIIDRIIQLRQEAESKKSPQIITLLGNHEVMIQNARLDSQNYTFWAINGGTECLSSFDLSSDSTLDEIPPLYWEFFDSLLPYHETDTHLLTHAGCDPALPLAEQTPEDLLWKRFHLAEAHHSGKTLVVGHTIQKDGYPGIRPGCIGIDTGSFKTDGWITALCLEDHSYLQANEKGETRTGKVPTAA